KVWDTATGRQVQELPADGGNQVAFSPDGKWLGTGGSKYRFWHVPSWQEEAGLAVDREQPHLLPRPLAFAPDGRLLALARSTTEVQLYDLTPDGRIAQVARLPSPAPQLISALSFSPDGSQLAVATEAGSVELWDLRRIRERLTDLGLDWDLPPYPPSRWDDRPGPLQMDVVGGEPVPLRR